MCSAAGLACIVSVGAAHARAEQPPNPGPIIATADASIISGFAPIATESLDHAWATDCVYAGLAAGMYGCWVHDTDVGLVSLTLPMVSPDLGAGYYHGTLQSDVPMSTWFQAGSWDCEQRGSCPLFVATAALIYLHLDIDAAMAPRAHASAALWGGGTAVGGARGRAYFKIPTVDAQTIPGPTDPAVSAEPSFATVQIASSPAAGAGMPKPRIDSLNLDNRLTLRGQPWAVQRVRLRVGAGRWHELGLQPGANRIALQNPADATDSVSIELQLARRQWVVGAVSALTDGRITLEGAIDDLDAASVRNPSRPIAEPDSAQRSAGQADQVVER